jgi:hypothetical protein
LRLSTCDVAIIGDHADATCDASFGDDTGSPAHLRRLTLARVDGAWTIRSTTD